MTKYLDFRRCIPSPSLKNNINEFIELRKLLEQKDIEVLCCPELMTEEETAQAMLDILAETAIKPITPGLNIKADINSRMAAIDKWLDRKKGKPVQSVDLRAEVKTSIQRINDDELALVLAHCKEPIIIPPAP